MTAWVRSPKISPLYVSLLQSHSHTCTHTVNGVHVHAHAHVHVHVYIMVLSHSACRNTDNTTHRTRTHTLHSLPRRHTRTRTCAPVHVHALLLVMLHSRATQVNLDAPGAELPRTRDQSRVLGQLSVAEHREAREF